MNHDGAGMKHFSQGNQKSRVQIRIRSGKEESETWDQKKKPQHLKSKFKSCGKNSK